MSQSSRKLLRRISWLALACCGLLDGALGEAAISGCCDVFFMDESGKIIWPRPEPELWLPIIGFVVIQGFLILALIRLRESEQTPSIL
jgi:hypothetical protein